MEEIRHPGPVASRRQRIKNVIHRGIGWCAECGDGPAMQRARFVPFAPGGLGAREAPGDGLRIWKRRLLCEFCRWWSVHYG